MNDPSVAAFVSSPSVLNNNVNQPVEHDSFVIGNDWMEEDVNILTESLFNFYENDDDNAQNFGDGASNSSWMPTVPPSTYVAMTSSPVVGTVSSFVTSRGQAVVSPTQQDESSSAPQGFQLFGKTGSYAAIVSSPNLAFVKTNEPSSGAKKPGMGTGRNQASPTAVVSQVDLLRRTSKSVGSTAKATFPVVIDSSATTPPLFGPATDAVAAAEAAAIQAKADRPKKVRARQTKAKKVKQYIPIAPALSLRNDKKRSTQSSSSVKEQFLQVVALHSSASSSSSSHKRAKTVAVNINDMSPPEQVQFRKERNCVLAKKT